MKRIREITIPDIHAAAAAKTRWDDIAKPLGSFGQLEKLIIRLAAVQGTDDVAISRRTVVVMCADHGVVREQVTQTGQSVTRLCAEDIAEGRSCINAVARSCGADVLCVDMGMVQKSTITSILDKRIAPGTQNMTKGAAMTYEQTERCIIAGMDIVRMLKENGVQIIVTGEMGIGNTTAASALASVLLNLPPSEVTGRGAGLSDEGLVRKIHAVETAITINQPDAEHPIELLSKLGGLEIAGMTGLFLGGAYYHVPVVIDGMISAAAAVVACRIHPLCREYLFPSHAADEPAGAGLLEILGLEPVIQAGLRLGEGTGGTLLLPLLDGALALYREGHQFKDMPMERYKPL